MLNLSVAGIAAWISVRAGALFTALQLWLSGTAQLQVVIPAMLFVHSLIGLGEAVITVAALSFVLQSRPDLLGENSESAKGSKGWIVAGIVLSLIVIFLSPLASTNPDGLNHVAMNLGFIHTAQVGTGPLARYTVPFLANASVSKIVAGILGAIVVFGLAIFEGRSLQKKS